MRILTAMAAAVALFSAGAACAAPVEVYRARLSEQDHFNSNGERLRTVAGVIRQDRANFHRFGMRDREDTDDDFFASADNRQRLEELLLRGTISGRDRAEILNGDPLVVVRVYRHYVDVEVQ